MSVEASFAAALVVGLLGGVHCLGMCGGIVGALTLGAHGGSTPSAGRGWIIQLAYNAGRISSYVAAGAIAGWLGAAALELSRVHEAQRVFLAIAGLFMVALGLYLGGWWSGLLRVERLGGSVWRRIEPLGRRLIPVRSAWQAFPLGSVWGWLPCGLVYSVLIWALAAGGAGQGALLMLGFGLGTLPNLLLIGGFASWVANVARRPALRWLAGALVIALGVYQLWQVSRFSA